MAAAHPELLAWLPYGGSAATYSAVVFHSEFPGGARIFSKENARSLRVILAIHTAFLAILLYAVHVAVASFPFLPSWLTVTVSRANTTLFEFIFIVIFTAVALLERKWLYVDSEQAGSEEDHAD